MSWTIQEVTRATGVTSRTLRHYDEIGLLPASFTGPGGIRHYDDDSPFGCSESCCCATWG